ncbi:MAG TPA: type IX secretion system protein PorQ [Flavobacteriaceae bacterium]|nr:type IX secretion system protein PorQ [Flavobacteriaceae bacterium]
MKQIVFLFFLYASFSYSQVGGERVYNFLNITSFAKQASLGGKTLTLLNNVNQPVWNPSTINTALSDVISVNYLNYLTDVNLASLSYAKNFNNLGTFHSNITYLNYGKFIEADEDGNELGTFKAYDLALNIGYAYQIPNSYWVVGANLKFINSIIQNYSSFGLATDLGFLYNNKNKPYVVTVVARNLGYQLSSYNEYREKLPLDIALGFAYQLQNVPMKWHLTIDSVQQWDISVSNPSNSETDLEGNTTEEEIGFFNNALRHFTLGVELFPKNNFNLNLGYNFRRAKELNLVDKRSFAGFTAGFGLKMNTFRINYAFSKYHSASNTSTFSLHINLN